MIPKMTLAARPIRKHHQLKHNNLVYFSIAVMGGTLLFLLLFVKNTSSAIFGVTSSHFKLINGTLQYKVFGDVQAVEYYHCSAPPSVRKKAKHLVLLHGARFTKEDWKTSGILDTLCSSGGHFSVSAMDLGVQAGHRELQGMLISLKDTLHIDLPVTLITPSASGMTITDWMSTGRLKDLPLYVERWMPIAAVSVSAATEDQLQRMAKLQPFQILAIHGTKDRGGIMTSERLQDYAQARTLELKGGHPCYLDSPKDFCNVILQELGT
jgi:hypothetical protein